MTDHRIVSRNLFIASALIGSMASYSTASAQSGSGSGTTAPPPAATAALDPNDIIVTATRRFERLENVPAAVVAVSGQALETAGVKRFQDLALVAPGVQISRSGIFTQPAIRGVSTIFAGGGQETNVAIYVDGFYTADNLSINQDFSNIQDIQVLKGPQGTLYGRNATGGAILITTRGPTDELTVNGSVSYAPRFDDRIASGFVAGLSLKASSSVLPDITARMTDTSRTSTAFRQPSRSTRQITRSVGEASSISPTMRSAAAATRRRSRTGRFAQA